MTSPPTIRLWPLWVVAAVTTILVILSVTPSIQNAARFMMMMAGPLLGLVLYLVWQLFFSRMPWKERFLIPALMILPVALPALLGDSSMYTAMWIYGVPLAIVVTAVTLTLFKDWERRRRYVAMGACLLAGWSFFSLSRLDGFDGDYWPEMAWRWSPTSEDLLPDVEVAGGDTAWQLADAEWPGFRGAHADSRTVAWTAPQDWEAAPPQERWRAPVGPAWSSFAYAEGRLFTQEQRGEDEVTSCLDAATGERLWEHRVASRFDELVSGSGPRATPTLANGRVYTLGGRGILSVLDAATGTEIWQYDLMAKLNAPLPMWGFSSSPVVTEGRVIVHAGPSSENGLVAFDDNNGEIVWAVPTRGMNFSSAQLVSFGGEEQVLFGDGNGLFALAPATGEEIWRYKPSAWEGPAMVQPQQVGENGLLAALGDGKGTAYMEVERNGDSWQIDEKWSSIALKPSFNDFVVHDGHIYGYDQNIFASVDLKTGERNWKRGRYGFGQAVLLAETGQLVVQVEKGDVLLLAADPEKHRELGRIKALDDKTWNHPIVAGGSLFVRNGREIVAFDLIPG